MMNEAVYPLSSLPSIIFFTMHLYLYYFSLFQNICSFANNFYDTEMAP